MSSPPEEAPQALAIVGPTATGKTALAIRVAESIGGEIIGMDSRQAYRGMAIGTAAPSPDELARVPHHGVGFLDPDERYSAGVFGRLARTWIREIRARGRVPILAGGTGFFLRALEEPVFREPELGPARQQRLRRWLAEQPAARLRAWVERLDPSVHARSPRLDRQRAARSLELALLSGRPLGWWHRHGEPEAAPVSVHTVVLSLGSEAHRERIRQRTDRLLDGGWREEVEALLASHFWPDAPALNAVGYREVAAWLAGETSREEVAEVIAGDTWQYARRQRTWFRHQLTDPVWLDASAPIDELVRRVEETWEAAGRFVGASQGGAAGNR